MLLPFSPTIEAPGNPKREWAPRIWMGCDAAAWWQLLSANQFAVDWTHAYIALFDTAVSVINSALWILSELVHGSRAARTEMVQAPLFILGHWRTGTTLLHELLVLDPRHSYPTTYQCLAPSHFLLTDGWMPRLLFFLMPRRRPMDNMAAGWERPQEDEFALCILGAGSPYRTIAFPNHPPQGQEYLDLEALSPAKRTRWKKTFLWFLRRLTLRDPRRLVLKSPTHTARIKTLLELFPDARFAHIVRDPYVVFASTMKLWKTLYETHGLQRPRCEGLEEHVFSTFLRLEAKLEEGRRLVPPGQFYQLRYEDLIRDPVGQLRQLYAALHLGDFEVVRGRLEKYLAENAGYEPNRHELTPELRAKVRQRWGDVIRRYGYEG
ncbi:MAG: sulfotransferase [Gemmataceae bacterium]|nr:sulfotransferase [Gemmataceae bacterium]MDW8265193.1 sulfotransferase [Gemmataceae bacterium]